MDPRRELVEKAADKVKEIPVEWLTEHLLSLYPHDEWPLLREGMRAILHRHVSAMAGEFKVVDAPADWTPFGTYTLAQKGKTRPCRVTLSGIGPIRASCGCSDFIRNSLGLCRHILALLAHLCRRPGMQAKLADNEGALAAAPLAWLPCKPLWGEGDWLAQVRWTKPEFTTDAEKRLAGYFDDPGPEGRRLRKLFAGNSQERLALVAGLAGFQRWVRKNRPPEAFDPALSPLLARELKLLRIRATNRGRRRDLLDQLGGMKLALYPYQREGVGRFLARGQLMLADDMGLGKTIQAIAGCHVLFGAGRVQRGLLLVPAPLKSQWLREWRRFTDIPAGIITGPPEKRRARFAGMDQGFLIGNYEQFLRDTELVRQWRPDLMVLDEAQRIKNWSTKTARTIKSFQPTYRLVLTGTPLENRLDELVSIVEWVDDYVLEPRWRLAPWHTEYADDGREIRGARNLGVLRKRLSRCLVRRTRQEVLDQLPPRTDTVLPVELTAGQWERHAALVRPIKQLMGLSRNRSLRRQEFLKLMQLLTTQRIISNGLAQADFPAVWPEITRVRATAPVVKSLESPKLARFQELVTELLTQPGRKIVVFSQWRRMLQLARWAIGPVLESRGDRALFFTGGESQQERARNIVSFHDDPPARLFFSTDAGGTGLNLQRAANCLVNLELPWNPAVLEQRIGRIYRIGQRQPIEVFNLVAEAGIEARIARLVGDKRSLFEGLFDGTTESVRYDGSGSFLARAEQLVEPEPPEEAAAVSAQETGDPDDPEEERRIEELLATADETGDPAGSRDEPGRAPDLTDLVQGFFGDLRVRNRPDGGVEIRADEDAARTLSALFRGMADLLGQARDGKKGR